MAKAKGRGVGVVTGVRDIDRRLRKLEAKIQKQIVRKAIAKGLAPVLSAARENAPAKSGELRRNIKIRAARGKRGVVRREVRVGSKQMDPFYGQFVEFGTKDAPPHPFMGPAYESEGPRARDVVLAELRGEIEREVKSLGSSGGPGASGGGGRARDEKGRFVAG